MTYCKKCGTEIEALDNFCEKCGTKIKSKHPTKESVKVEKKNNDWLNEFYKHLFTRYDFGKNKELGTLFFTILGHWAFFFLLLFLIGKRATEGDVGIITILMSFIEYYVIFISIVGTIRFMWELLKHFDISEQLEQLKS